MNSRFLFSVFILLLTGPLAAQDLSEAQRLAAAGDHPAAEKIYDAALAINPGNAGALTGAGYNYSWWKRPGQARQKFEAALALEPGNAAALAGQGYNAAWAGNYQVAKNYFKKLQQLQPGSVEAKKGLAYVHLWSGNGQVAERLFEELVLENPQEIEFYIALAQANLLENKAKRARIALASGLQLHPQHPVASQLLAKTYSLAAPFELDTWGGYSAVDGDSRFSLRTVQLSAQITRPLRLYLKYDNSLTLDLASLIRSSQEAQAFSAGSIVTWNSRLTSRLEYGARLLPGSVTQQIAGGEQVFVLSEKLSVKGGGLFGWGQGIAREWLAYGSLRVPLTAWYAVEPYYFRSKVENSPEAENRLMFNNQLRSHGGYELNLGLTYGKAGLGNEVADRNLYGAYATAILPFGRTVWGLASFRYEKAPS